MNDNALNLTTLSNIFANEDKAREFLESKRWPNGPICPHCGGAGYKLTPKPTSRRPGRNGLKKCKVCRKQFTVRIGTIFEESKIDLRKWLMAIHLMTSSKKGVSSHQISRELGITVKSAWFLTMRIREAMRREPLAGMLKGEVEVDEAYIGGKPRKKGTSKRGRGTSKQPIIVLVERDGRVRCKPIDSISSETLHGEVKQHVDSKATIFTDELSSYGGIGEHFDGGHHTVNHSADEYARKTSDGLPVHVNTAESYFAIIKRSHYGIHHHFSKRHLHRYCDERGFVWDHRNVTDGERMIQAIKGTEGKRLYYREPTRRAS